MLVVVLIGFKGAVALKQPETMRIAIAEGGDLQRLAVRYRPPNPFALASEHLQAADLMDGRPDIVRPLMIERAERIGGRHGAKAEMIDRRPGDQGQFRIDDRRLARTQCEAIGASDARRVEQRVDDQNIFGWIRLLDPDRAKRRKFFALRLGCANGKAARIDAEILATRLTTEKTRPLIDGDFERAAVGLPNHAKARKPDVRQVRGDHYFAEVERGALVTQLSRKSPLDDENVHRRRENETAVQRFDREADTVAAPDCRGRLWLDLRILFVSQVDKDRKS